MKTLVHFKEFCDEIRTSASRKFKQEVLTKYKDDEVIKKYLQIAYDPYTVFGISTKKLTKRVRPEFWYQAPTVFDLFDYLTKHNTGADVDVAACQEMLYVAAELDVELENLLMDLICKDLSLGVDEKSINSVMPGLIPSFNVQLANKYFDKPEYVSGKKFALTTKIDGGRIIAIKENGQVSFYTRAGQRYEGLVDLEKEMLETFPEGTVLDGEITILNDAGIPSKEAYKRAMKITRSDGEKHGLKMKVFDTLDIKEWRAQKCETDYVTRRALLEGLYFQPAIQRTYFELLPELYRGTDTSKILELLNEAIANQEEGVMINICDAKYEFKRTNSLLKVKKMNTLDLEIIGFEEGEGRLAGTLGAILVRYKDGNVVKVGSGFSDAIRSEIWKNRNDWLGTVNEIQFFEETTNADGGISLRFPVWKDRRYDKILADF
jgi:DNA ligase-1